MKKQNQNKGEFCVKALVKVFSFVFVCILSFCFVGQEYARAEDYQTIEAEIPIVCMKVQEREGQDYDIIIEPDDQFSPRPRNEHLMLTEHGTGKFQIDVSEPGTYSYRIYEKPGEDESIIYDSRVYYMTLFVVSNQIGGFSWSISAKIYGEDGKPYIFEFRNEGISQRSTPVIELSYPSEPEEDSYPKEHSRPEISYESHPESSGSTDRNLFGTGDKAPIFLFSVTAVCSAVVSVILSSSRKKHLRKSD